MENEMKEINNEILKNEDVEKIIKDQLIDVKRAEKER